MQKGEFVRIDYIGRIASTGEIFDLTSEEAAKKEGVFNPKQKYGPVLVIIGAGTIVPGVEKKLEGMKKGEESEFTVKPDEGFGDRDPRLIKIISISQFTKQKLNPMPGMFVTVNGVQGRVQGISGGRVRVDFNHPLAGKDLKYRVKLIDVVEGTLEKAKGILEHYGIPKSEGSVLENKALKVKTPVKVPPSLSKHLAETIKKWIKEIETVDFITEEKKPESSEPEKKEK